MLITLLPLLDLIGTFAFATYGAYLALRQRYDLFGIITCAFITAVGGGTLRDIILGRLPVYFFNYTYLFIIVLAVLLVLFLKQKFLKIEKWIQFLDAIGLVTFAYIGAATGAQANLGLFAIICLAMVTAVGGGVMRDLLLNKQPEIMYRDVYASVAIIVGLLYSILPTAIVIIIGLVLRLIVVKFRLSLWRPLP